MSEEKSQRVPNDPTFTRHYADIGLAYFLGRHVNIVFIQNSPAVALEIIDEKIGYAAEVDRSAVSNIRISINAAVGLAIDILEEASSSKGINKEKIVQNLNEIIEKLESGDSDDAASDKS